MRTSPGAARVDGAGGAPCGKVEAMRKRLKSLLPLRNEPERRAPPGSPLAYVLEPDLLRESNRVELLRRGEQAYPAMLAAIAGARDHVHLETYILRSDATGKRFQQALIERAHAGVMVRLLYDSIGSFGLVSDEFLSELASAGVEIVEFHPVTPWRRRLIVRLRSMGREALAKLGRRPRRIEAREPSQWSVNRRDHQKVLVVDGLVAFTGGINIGDEYAPAPGGDWHDLHVRVEGPAALGFARIFHRAWLKGDGDPFARPPRARPAGPQPEPMLAHTCDNFRLRSRRRFYAAYRHAIDEAQSSVSIMNAYFVPDFRLIRSLKSAAERKVVVRVIVPAESDVRLVGFASRYLFERLLAAGVRIFEYSGRMMHAKAATVDGAWSTIGSFNLDRRSMLHNLEAGLVILDRDFAKSLEREFDASLEACREVDLRAWRRRGAMQRFKEWFAHLFAYWL
jgi:cardiolipin synthase